MGTTKYTPFAVGMYREKQIVKITTLSINLFILITKSLSKLYGLRTNSIGRVYYIETLMCSLYIHYIT
ncbi:hypothetical protein SDC9_80675 [bioreactor metagenome]|uniref:Uncharacterized protein n=1 Tax=bioreactor metagenome TaxID=1076179 RepID=A0A644Z7M7_9ZZZZ